jgi:P4 family phage/plasmid primase-like protien
MCEKYKALKKLYYTNSDNVTHTSMAGGKYSLCDKSGNLDAQNMSIFYKQYYDSVVISDENDYLTERVLDSFKFFIDIDTLKCENEPEKSLTDSDIINITNFYNPNENIVCKRQNRYHIVFYEMVTDKSQACENVSMLLKQFPEYSKIIDTSVYSSGLRMIHSLKKKGEQKNVENYYRIYSPDTGKHIDKPTYEQFLMTSILVDNSRVIQKNTVLGPKTLNVVYNIPLEVSEIFEQLRIQNTSVIRNQQISNCKLQEMDSSIFYFITTNDKFCPFVNREHKRDSNPVYYMINKDTKASSLRCHDAECNSKKIQLDLVYLSVSQEQLMNCLPYTDYKMAEYIFSIYKDKYRIDSIKTGNIYKFGKDKRWKISCQLYIDISRKISKQFEELYVYLKESDPENAKKVMKVIEKLQTTTSKSNLMKELGHLMYNHDPEFYNKLDSNPWLIHFKHGIVVDFHTATPRTGLPSDYITFTTGIEYKQYDPNDKYVLEIYELFEKIMPMKEEREYLFKTIAKSLSGLSDENVYFWTGIKGSNGKSTTSELVENTFGQYSESLDCSNFTGKRAAASGPTPNIMKLRGKSPVFIQESNATDVINSGFMKQVSGSDTLIARQLYEPICTFRFFGTLFFCLNNLPIFDTNDGGVWRRVKVLEFNSRFCENPKLTNEFKIDYDIKNKIKSTEWTTAFASIILHYAKLLLTEPIIVPCSVKIDTENYKNDNDKFIGFSEMFEYSGNSFISTNELYSRFSGYWMDNNPTIKVPEKEKFKLAIKQHHGKEYSKGKLRGYYLTEI